MIVRYKKFLDKILKGVLVCLFLLKKIVDFSFDTNFGRFSR